MINIELINIDLKTKSNSLTLTTKQIQFFSSHDTSVQVFLRHQQFVPFPLTDFLKIAGMLSLESQELEQATNVTTENSTTIVNFIVNDDTFMFDGKLCMKICTTLHETQKWSDL